MYEPGEGLEEGEDITGLIGSIKPPAPARLQRVVYLNQFIMINR